MSASNVEGVGWQINDASGFSSRGFNNAENDALGNNVGMSPVLPRRPQNSMTTGETPAFTNMGMGDCSFSGIFVPCSMAQLMNDGQSFFGGDPRFPFEVGGRASATRSSISGSSLLDGGSYTRVDLPDIWDESTLTIYAGGFLILGDGGGSTRNVGSGGGGGGGGSGPDENQVACGINPMTGSSGINAVNSGIQGEIRPGERGRGEFGSRRRNGGRVYAHTGTDVSAPVGTPVFPFASGLVSSVTGSTSDTKGNGLMIIINHGNGYTSRYGHLSGAGVVRDDRAVSGAISGVIGWSGQSGNANGQEASEAHVHFEIRKNGKILNPEKFLNAPCPKDFDPRTA